VSIVLRYAANGDLVQASTRGDGNQGDDVTANAITVQGVLTKLEPAPGYDIEVRGEILMPESVFTSLQSQNLSTPRNAAAGSLRQLDPAITKKRKLLFIGYEILAKEGINYDEKRKKLSQWGFMLPEPWDIVSFAQSNINETAVALANYHTQILKMRNDRELGVDGVVYKVNSWEACKNIGSTAKAPRWAIAYKYEDSAAVAATRLNGIRVSVGKRGILTPVAELEPVKLGDVTVSSATLHNPSNVRSVLKGVRLGDSVLVRRAGDVIPQLISSSIETETPGDFDDWIPPDRCPSCGTEPKQIDDTFFCPAAFDCPAQATARLVHFFSRPALDLKAGLGKKKLEQLVDNHLVNTAADLLTFGTGDDTHINTLAQLDGWGPKSAKKLLDALYRIRTTPVPLTRFLIALGIPRIGNACAISIAKHYEGSFHDLWSILKNKDATEQRSQLAALPGVGPAAVDALHAFALDPADREHTERLLQLISLVV